MSPKLDKDLLIVVEKVAKVISADSAISESTALDELVSGLAPFVNKSEWATGDLAVLKRGIEYILYTHSFTRLGASTHTFLAMLEALMEVVLPTVVQDHESSVFLEDIKLGIERAKKQSKGSTD